MWFVTLGGILGVFLLFTLPRSPFLIFADERPEKVIAVEARRFSFALVDESPEKKWVPTESTSGIVLPAGAWWSFASRAAM
jgi:hypothetical protein